jgi:hypothetical protein
MPRETKPVERHIPRFDHVITKITCSRCGKEERISRTYAHHPVEERITGRFTSDLEFASTPTIMRDTECGQKWPTNLVEKPTCAQNAHWRLSNG